MEKHEPFLKLIHMLLESSTDPGQIHACPVCGGELKVTFGTYIRGARTLVGTTTDCRQCDIRLHIDTTPAPAWAPIPDDEAVTRSNRLHRERIKRDPPSSCET